MTLLKDTEIKTQFPRLHGYAIPFFQEKKTIALMNPYFFLLYTIHSFYALFFFSTFIFSLQIPYTTSIALQTYFVTKTSRLTFDWSNVVLLLF